MRKSHQDSSVSEMIQFLFIYIKPHVSKRIKSNIIGAALAMKQDSVKRHSVQRARGCILMLWFISYLLECKLTQIIWKLPLNDPLALLGLCFIPKRITVEH